MNNYDCSECEMALDLPQIIALYNSEPIPEPDTLRTLRKLWLCASQQDRVNFIEWMTDLESIR
jgi:hypothetical protein